ncbi:MAG: Cof-type HAD-IIB family hydrolase [Candidatus Wallbacteria bacterium]|nr:Cof-type HAD-IIB family hydrolase [Candidatus Wallbacteria bacterium]
MPWRLVALDLDGTLLDSAYRLSMATAEKISSLSAKGMAFVFVTGRMHLSALAYQRKLGMEFPIISYNGALARSGDKTLFHDPLRRGALAIIAGKFSADRLMLLRDDRLFVRRFSPAVRRYIFRARVAYNYSSEALENLDSLTKVILIPGQDFESDLFYARETMGNYAHVTYSSPSFIEMMAPGVNKARALERVAAFLGIGMDETVAFGDGENDLEMIRAAGLGVAMGNAAQSLKECADDVCGTNNEDGVCRYLGRICG